MPDMKNSIDINYDIIKNYKSDINRNSIDIINDIENTDGRPCFYLTDDSNNPQILSFGHTPMYRLVYEFDIKAHNPLDLNEKFDLSEMIYGNEKDFAGRVFFEDSFCDSNLNDVSLGSANPKILANPNTTCFQHYLTQDSNNIRNLKHYNRVSNKLAEIRGYKLYWNKANGYQWSQTNQTEINNYLKQYNHQINPVKSGIEFTGIIRFENLTEIELGALLFVLKLPDECCHKIGMAKPYGLGSIKITPELYLSNRIERYKSFKTEFNGLEISNDLEKIKSEFEKFIKTKISIKEESIWDYERMKQLKEMLNIGIIKNNTEYMPLGYEFTERKVLPKPTDVN